MRAPVSRDRMSIPELVTGPSGARCTGAGRGRIPVGRTSGPGGAALAHHTQRMTLLWFVVWLISDNVGGREVLRFDPVNVWAGLLILAIALDLGSAHARPGRRS